jgi:hypothetical protein
MDRRREPRIDTDELALITLLGDHSATYCARIVNFSGRGMRLVLDRPLPRNAPIRVDWKDCLLLGEVCYNAEQDGEYAVGLMLDQSINGVSELAQLAQAALDEHCEVPAHPVLKP